MFSDKCFPSSVFLQVLSDKCFPSSIFRQVCSVKCFPSSMFLRYVRHLWDGGVFRSIGNFDQSAILINTFVLFFYSQGTVVRTSLKNVRLWNPKGNPITTKENHRKPKNPRVPSQDKPGRQSAPLLYFLSIYFPGLTGSPGWKNLGKYSKNQQKITKTLENIRKNNFHPENPSDQDETGLPGWFILFILVPYQLCFVQFDRLYIVFKHPWHDFAWNTVLTPESLWESIPGILRVSS